MTRAIIVLAVSGIFMIVCWLVYWYTGKLDKKAEQSQERRQEAKSVRLAG